MNLNTKQTALLTALCAIILGLTGLFLWLGIDAVIPLVAAVVIATLLLNIILLTLGRRLSRSFVIKKWMKRTGFVLFLTITAFVPICVVIYIVQDRMFFYNVHDAESRAFLQNKTGYHEVEFTAANGKTYHGMMYQASDDRAPLIIYFGGNGECSYRNLRIQGERKHWPYFAGYNYLFVDYEGYGLNEGQASYQNMYEESLAVYDYTVTLPNVNRDHIVSMGYSIGTGCAAYLAANRPTAGLILVAPYANAHDLYNAVFPVFFGPFKLLEKQKFATDDYAPKITCSTLVIASRSDEEVPFESSARLVTLFPGDVDFMTLDHTHHNEMFTADVFDKLQKFLEGI